MTIRRSYRYEGGNESPTVRLEALADGVFAIAMTLLVFGLGIPVVDEVSNGELAAALGEMWPEFLIYLATVVALFIGFTMVGRWEAVTTWVGAADTDAG